MPAQPQQDPRFAYQGAFTGGFEPMDGEQNRAYWDRTGRAQNAATLDNQRYARAMGEGTRYEQEVARRQRQMLDDAREREQYSLALGRRADGLPQTEEGRQFDSRMNIFSQLLQPLRGGAGGSSSAGGGIGGYGSLPATPPMPASGAADNSQINNSIARFLQAQIGRR